MAIERIKQKDGIVYRAVFYKHQRRMRKFFKRKLDAQEWLNKQESHHKFGFQAKLFFKDAAELWLQNHSLVRKSPGCHQLDKRVVEKSLIPFFGSADLESITSCSIESYISSLKSKEINKDSASESRRIKNATVNRYLAILSSILNSYVKKRYLSFNPVSVIGLLPEDEVGFDYLSFEEADRFLTYAQKKYQDKKQWVYRFYLLAINSGLRWGEIAALKWDKISLAQKQLIVARTYCKHTLQIRETTKGRKIRYVGINSSLLPELEKQYQDSNTAPSGLVFPGTNGKALDLKNFKRDCFDKDLRDAEIREIRFHDLRHTFASHFMMRGGNLYDLQKLLGHSNITTTERYAHLSPESLVLKTELVAINGGNNVVSLEARRKQAS